MIGELCMVSFLVGVIEKEKKGYFYGQIDSGLQTRQERTGKISLADLFNTFFCH